MGGGGIGVVALFLRIQYHWVNEKNDTVNRSSDLCTLVAFSDSFSLLDCNNNNSMYQFVNFTLYVCHFILNKSNN